MELHHLRYSVESRPSEEMLILRQLCYPAEYKKGECEDAFDAKSTHVVVRLDKQLLAYGRLTPGPEAVFYTWTKGKAQLPYGADSIDLGRCMVHPDFRRNNLFELICIVAMQYASSQGFNYINGAVVEGSPWVHTLERIGLQKSGPVVQGKSDLIQPLSCNLIACKAEVVQRFEQLHRISNIAWNAR
jgi:predicted GNAT family N-acyltransferase